MSYLEVFLHYYAGLFKMMLTILVLCESSIRQQQDLPSYK
jgi:hypothetical protein